MEISDILAVLRHLAPEESALENDPIGLLVDRESTEVTKVGVCLDATPATVERAMAAGVQLIIAHHPLIYRPLKRLGSDPVSVAVKRLVSSSIALYAMHTNWDAAPGGINDTLAECLELADVQPLGTEGLLRLPRLGTLASPRPLADFARLVETALSCAETSALRCGGGDPHRMISRVAVCGGAGAELGEAVQAAGADAYVTSDVRHDQFWDAEARGLALLDAGHSATETPGMRVLVRKLPALLPWVEVVWVGD